MTMPGFSSRSSTSAIRQFPMRDEAAMTQPEIGFSNSSAVKDAPQDVYPDVQPAPTLEPGYSNDLAVGPDGKVVSASTTESKTVKKAAKK